MTQSRNVLKRISSILVPHKTVPRTWWTGNGRWDLSIPRVGILTFGLAVFGIGEALLISEIDVDIKRKTIDVDIQQRTVYITGDGLVTDSPPTEQD